MLNAIKTYYGIVLLVMLIVTFHAQSCESIFAIPRVVQSDPWFAATLWDAYFGFLSFYFWVCYKENSVISRAVWLIAILLLGNIAMSIYALKALFSLKSGDGVEQLLTKRNATPQK